MLGVATAMQAQQDAKAQKDELEARAEEANVEAQNRIELDKSTGNQAKSIEDILEGATDTTNNAGVAKNFEKTGGFEKTLEDFDDLNPSNVKDIQTQYGSGKVGTLSDGTRVVARPGSATGGATLEIKISNKKLYKIRY